MNLDSILGDLREQRDRIQAAIDALERTSPHKAAKPRGRKPRRHLSAEARAKIAAAAKRRWDAARKAGKTSLKK